MNISEVKSLVEGASYEEKLGILERIWKYSGDCQENGYLGSSISNISYDEFLHLEFQSEFLKDDLVVKSMGAVLDNSVVIMQVQEVSGNKILQLYSWKLDGTSYTYFTFDSMSVLEKAYFNIKKLNKGFLAENIEDDLVDIGISYRDIMDIKVAISVNHQTEKASEDERLEFDKLVTSFV